MTNKITDAATIRSFIEKGVRVCPEGVDENTFNVLLAAYAPTEIEDAPFETVTPAGQKNALVASEPTFSTAVALPSDGQAFGLDDFEASGSAVDGWISVSSGVFKIKGDAITMPAEGIKCVLHGECTKFAKGIRCTMPGNANEYKYFKTYNGQKTVDGESWPMVVEKCQRLDSNSYVYDLVEMELTLEDNVMAVGGKKLIMEAGARIGFGNAPSAGKYIKAFNNELKKEGKTICSPDVPVVLKGFLVERKTGNPYQIVTIEKR